jgi:hypothetical protein
MPPTPMEMCTAMAPGGLPGTFHPCTNIGAWWRLVLVDGHWAVRVVLCDAHQRLWSADVGPNPIAQLRLSTPAS